MCILKVENLVKSYGSSDDTVVAVDDISFSVEKGEFISIAGKSGSGKTTLLHLIGGLDQVTSGRVVIAGKDIAMLNDEELSIFRRRKIGFVFQNYNLMPILNVRDNILLPLGLDHVKEDPEFFSEVVSILEIQDKLNCIPKNLSGGEQQRVAIARALITKPSIVLADEPTGNLDSETSNNVLRLMGKTGKRFGQTVIMVTHNEAIAKGADRMICLEKGKISSMT